MRSPHLPRTLALGRPDTLFYRSLRPYLPAFGEIIFRHERTFLGPRGVARLMRRRGIHRVLMPNPYGNPHRLRIYRGLRAQGATVIVSDRGALPGSWFFDAGFNADSPSYAPEAWDRPLSEDEHRAIRSYMDEVRRGEAALEAQGTRKPLGELRKQLDLGGAKVLFVPLQRPADTVIRYFAGATGSVQGFLGLVEGVARTLGDEWRVVVKQHPLEPAGIPLRGDRIVVAPDDTHVHDLLELADGVLAINSGVGVLALLFGKPTFCAGQAFYGHEGLARQVWTAEDAVTAIEACEAPDAERVTRFLHHLRTRVYSFGRFSTRLVPDGEGGASRRVTDAIEFRELRILGQTVEVPRERILIVSPVVPYPVTRGSEMRVDMMVQSLLGRGAGVSLCVLNADAHRGDTVSTIARMRERHPELREVAVMNHPRIGSLRARLAFWIQWLVQLAAGGRHLVANVDTAPPGFRRLVRNMVAKLLPTHVVINYAKLSPCLPRRFGGVSILDTHDDQTSLLLEGQSKSRNRRDILVPLYRRSERRALRRFDRIIAISPAEAPSFRESAPRSEVVVVPAFTTPERPSHHLPTCDALFVGSRSSFNVHGLRWFLSEVLPIVRANHPSFELRVVGSVCDVPAVRKGLPPGVRLDGVVRDIASAYDACRMVIAPILAGAGMKIKVIEALGYRKAVVCTSSAARGIRIESRRHAIVADDPEDFAIAVGELMNDERLRARLGEGARELHERDHSRDAAEEALEHVFSR